MSTAPVQDGEWSEPPAIHPLLRRHLRLATPPMPLTTLLGREAEAAAVSAMLTSGETRLVSLIGPGGIGKTRLALGIAAAVADAFDDQVAWVPVATATSSAMVAAELAHAIGLPHTGAASLFEDLQAALRDETLLLIIDNIAQVLDAAPFLSDLLVMCPGLSLLVTSRALLRIDGEHPVDVPPLATELIASASLQSSGLAPAVQLFAQRAASGSPTFVLTAETTPVVAEICRRLDGLPLAIELAAERSLLLSPVELLDRLDRRLPHLIAGRRDGPARHRTMRDAIAWSYDLLTPIEQSVLCALSVFAGGCTLVAAEAVCLEPVIADGRTAVDPGPDASHVIESLIAQSLVRIASALDGEMPRLVMLETIREFAAERLAASGDDGPRRRHAAYFRDLTSRAEWELVMGDFRTWNTLLAAERANLRVAVDWALQEQDTDTALQLVTTMYSAAWISSSFAQEKEIYLSRALALPGGTPATRIEALAIAIRMAPAHFDRALTAILADEALAAVRGLGDDVAMARLHAALGIIMVHIGDEERAKTHLNQAAEGYRRASATIGLAWAQCELAVLDSRDAEDEGGDAEALAIARARYDEAVALFRAADYPRGLARALHGLAYVTYKQRDLPQALASTQECLARSWALRAPVFAFLEDIADIAGRIGQGETAARLYGAADAERERFALPLEPQYRAEYERDAAVARHAIGDDAFTAGWAAGRSLTEEQAVAIAVGVSIRTAANDVPADTQGLLTRRELEVMRLLAAGLSDRAIAEHLFIGERTVNTHVAHVFAKLGVRNRAAAVTAAVAAGLVNPDVGGTDPA
ncbi:MAG: ATP-binding protein [Thermomicrobiales bacterium]